MKTTQKLLKVQWEAPVNFKLREFAAPLAPTLKALIIYDDVAWAANTNAMLHRAAHRADVATKWSISPWRSNMLKTPATACEALDDAVDADLIIFAVRCFPRLNGSLMDWLEQWFDLRLTHEPALAVFCGSALEAKATAFIEISNFARRKGLDFIINYSEVNSEPEFLKVGDGLLNHVGPVSDFWRQYSSGAQSSLTGQSGIPRRGSMR
jgi:hypothetical protein